MFTFPYKSIIKVKLGKSCENDVKNYILINVYLIW